MHGFQPQKKSTQVRSTPQAHWELGSGSGRGASRFTLTLMLVLLFFGGLALGLAAAADVGISAWASGGGERGGRGDIEQLGWDELQYQSKGRGGLSSDSGKQYASTQGLSLGGGGG